MKKYIIEADEDFRASNVTSFGSNSTCTEVIKASKVTHLNGIWVVETELFLSQILLIKGIRRAGCLGD